MKTLFFAQIFSTFALTGVIWLIQIVHYPLFKFVGAERYREFHAAHMNWISFVVAPTMIVELICAGLIFVYPPKNSEMWILILGAVLVGVIWASTFFLQVPLHEKLAQGFDSETHNALVQTNWIRTIAWSLRTALVLWLAWKTI